MSGRAHRMLRTASGVVLGAALCACVQPHPGRRKAPPADSAMLPTTTTPGTTTPDPDPWVDVAAGHYETCGVRASGKVMCWGGLDRTTDRVPDGAFDRVAAVMFGACARNLDGHLRCWACDRQSTCSPPDGPMTSLWAGAMHFCATHADTGAVDCWGLPSGVFEDLPPYPAVVATGNERTCALPTVPSEPVCWGSPWLKRDYPWVLYPPAGLQLIDVAIGSVHGCGLDPQGEVHCWGTPNLTSTDPAEVEPYPDCPFEGPFVAIETWNRDTCVQDPDGVWHCWGPEPWNLLDAPEIPLVKLSIGDFHACGLTADGEIVCFGDDTYGETAPPP